MKSEIATVDDRFQVFAEKLMVESISETEARFKRTAFGCNGKMHAKDTVHETYEGLSEGDLLDVDRENPEMLGACDESCSGNVNGRRGWFTVTP